ncbi:hypothetical protein D6W19_003125 [Escherichia coli]|nr:hypothetical protein [Escherichia coli]
MNTITKEYTKEQLIEWAQKHKKRAEEYLIAVPNDEYGLKDLALAEIALAALTAEPAKCGHVDMDCDDGKAVCLSCGKVWEV